MGEPTSCGPWSPTTCEGPCLGCGQLIDAGSRCTRCDSRRVRSTPGRSSSAQAAFRRAVLARAGSGCEAVEHGKRYTVTFGLSAHHRVAVVDGGSMSASNGVALCGHHHAMVEVAERRARRG